MSYRETVEMYGASHEFSAHNQDGKRQYGATYVIVVDGEKVAEARWMGGRRYVVKDDAFDVRTEWEFITQSDGGKVADVAQYVGYAHLHEVHDRQAAAS